MFQVLALHDLLLDDAVPSECNIAGLNCMQNTVQKCPFVHARTGASAQIAPTRVLIASIESPMTKLPRILNLKGASNFRDLGGYATQHGRRVRWRRLFRSNHLGHLTADDIATLRALSLRKVIDFRSDVEIRHAAPCRLQGPTIHMMPIDPAIRPRLDERLAAGETVTAASAARIICDIYRGYVHGYASHFARLFDELLEDGTPLVFHCSAGKDRTGIAAALILSALGVPREVALEDYLLTNRHWRIDAASAAGLPDEVAAVLGSANEAFLSAAFAAIDSDFGGMPAYLRDRLNVDTTKQARLAELYLEP